MRVLTGNVNVCVLPVCVYLQTIVLFHHSIRGAMEVFASEAAALQQQPGVSAVQLSGLVERHRWAVTSTKLASMQLALVRAQHLQVTIAPS
jgi:hypothetical protein